MVNHIVWEGELRSFAREPWIMARPDMFVAGESVLVLVDDDGDDVYI